MVREGQAIGSPSNNLTYCPSLTASINETRERDRAEGGNQTKLLNEPAMVHDSHREWIISRENFACVPNREEFPQTTSYFQKQ